VLALADLAVWARPKWPTAACALTVASLALPLWGCSRISLEAGRAYLRQPAEEFTGARLHLSPWQTSTLANLVANARWNGDVLFSLPGMFSFNLWTALPTPTSQNITHWWSLLDDSKQSDIVAKLGAATHPVIIVQRNLLTSGLAKTAYHPSLLTRFIEERFEKIFALDSYEFWVCRDRKVFPVGIARWNASGATEGFSFYGPVLGTPAIARLEFVNYQDLAQPMLPPPVAFSVANAPADGGRLTQWICTCTTSAEFPRASCDAARFFAADGRLLAEARFERPLPQANPL
jgi:hypothetical protein